MTKMSKKNILILIGVSILMVFIGYLGSINSKEYYETLILPDLAPPSIVFPIAWGIIYTLMIAGAVIIEYYVTNPLKRKDAITSYLIQLGINVLWPYWFFVFKLNLIAFIWIVILFIAVFITFRKFYRLNKLAGILYIPYLLWLIYAGYINLGVLFLN